MKAKIPIDQISFQIGRVIIVILFLIAAISCLNDPSKKNPESKIVRKGSIIRIKPEKLELYRNLHANPWPEVNQKLKECNIQNYSIFYRDGFLFSYLEYTGKNLESDMKKLSADSVIQTWWKLTDPCQVPIESIKEGEWWANMEEIYHLN